MSRRVLFIATLHHPRQLIDDIAATPAGEDLPLFPQSMELYTWGRAFRAAGYEMAVFWRNLPGYGSREIGRLRDEHFSSDLTPRRALTWLGQRIPPRLQPGMQRRNQLLLEHARQFQPGLVWLSGGNREILPDTLERLKGEHGCKLLFVHGDSPIVFSSANERAAAPLYDLTLVNDRNHGAQWRELGAPKVACLPYVAVDPEHHRPQPVNDAPNGYLCDVGFVGTLTPDHLYSERVAALESLRDFDLGIWSVHEAPESLADYTRGAALGKRMLEVASSMKICVNPHGNTMREGVNLRVFECAALGAFQIVDERAGIARCFDVGEHLVTYSDLADLRDKVAYFLAHDDERREIAAAARAHVLANHTYAHRLAEVERLLE